MVICSICNEADYEAALKEIERYFEREPAPGTPEADRFKALARLIVAYEREHWPIDLPEPIEPIQCHSGQCHSGQCHSGGAFGSRTAIGPAPNHR